MLGGALLQMSSYKRVHEKRTTRRRQEIVNVRRKTCQTSHGHRSSQHGKCLQELPTPAQLGGALQCACTRLFASNDRRW